MIELSIRTEKNRRIIEFSIYKSLFAILLLCMLTFLGYFIVKTFVIPIGRVEQASNLVMYGDMNHDNEWGEEDAKLLS